MRAASLHELVVAGVDEVGELDLGDRAEPGEREADPDADDRRLGERRVEHPVGAELGGQPVGGAEHAAARTDVLAEHDHPLVAGEEVVLGLADRVDHVPLGRQARQRRARRRRATGWSPAPSGTPRSGPERAGEDLRVGVGRLGERLGLGPLGGLVDLRLHLGLDALLVGLGQEALLDEVLLDLPQRVLLPPGLHLLGACGRCGRRRRRCGPGSGTSCTRRASAPRPAGRGGPRRGWRRTRRAGRCRRRSRRRSRSRGPGRRRRRPRTPASSARRSRSRCSRRRTRIGSWWMPAKLSASWKSPFDVAPSPK